MAHLALEHSIGLSSSPPEQSWGQKLHVLCASERVGRTSSPSQVHLRGRHVWSWHWNSPWWHWGWR